MAADNKLFTARTGLKPGMLTPGQIGGEDRLRPAPDTGRDREPEQEAVSDAGKDQDYQPPAKKSDPLPKPGDTYRACARFLNRLSTDQRLIHFVDDGVRVRGLRLF